MKEKIGFIAIGQAGGNLGVLLKRNGFDVVFINTSTGDLDTLNVQDNLKYHINNGLGCAKDRELAKDVAKKDFTNIKEFIDSQLKEREIYYFVFSSSGGTGSGISPTLANIFVKAYNKRVGLITILPSDRDTPQAHINSYQCFQDIILIGTELSGSFILDNNKRIDIEHINKSFISHFSKLFDYKRFETSKGNIDEAEILKLLKTNGMINIAICDNNESTKKLIENIRDGVFAPLENDGRIKYLGLSKGIIFDEKMFKTEIGKYLDKFENVNKEYTMAILSGLSLPIKRINTIKAEIVSEKELIEVLNNSNSAMLENLDFISNSQQEKEIKNPNKMTAEDILNNFF